jgi:hypothetical protein
MVIGMLHMAYVLNNVEFGTEKTNTKKRKKEKSILGKL